MGPPLGLPPTTFRLCLARAGAAQGGDDPPRLNPSPSCVPCLPPTVTRHATRARAPPLDTACSAH